MKRRAIIRRLKSRSKWHALRNKLDRLMTDVFDRLMAEELYESD